MEPCTFDLIRSVAIGKAITSAGDFGSYLEFGLNKRFNLGFHENGFHLMSTETPVEDHRFDPIVPGDDEVRTGDYWGLARAALQPLNSITMTGFFGPLSLVV